MNDPRREQRAEAQRTMVANCRAAMPREIDALWDTIIHAPNHAFEPVVEALEQVLPDLGERRSAVLAWLGHGGGACPVCRMLVGPLLFTFPEPIQGLRATLAVEPSVEVLDGAGLFLASQLQPRHARAAGISNERLAELKSQVASLPGDVKQRLIARWETAGGAPDALALLG